MGLYRLMCRQKITPCWRRNPTLILMLIVVGAATYFIYIRSQRHRALTDVFMDAVGGGKEIVKNFWETHGGQEIDARPGKIRFRDRHGHKVAETLEEEEDVKYDDPEEEIKKYHKENDNEVEKERAKVKVDEEREGVQAGKYTNAHEEERGEEEENDEERVKEEGKGNDVGEENNGERVEGEERGNDVEEGNGGERVVEEERENDVEERNDGGKVEEEERENDVEEGNKGGRVVEEERGNDEERDKPGVREQDEQDEQEPNHAAKAWDYEEEERLRKLSEQEKRAARRRENSREREEIEKSRELYKKQKAQGREAMNKKEEEYKAMMEQKRKEDILLRKNREKMEAKRRRMEFARQEAAQHVNAAAGVVDAVLPERKVLETWGHDKLEATFHNYVTLPQIHCGVKVRMGGRQHGGWDFCHAYEFRPRMPCLMYSFGFNTDYEFEDQIAQKYGCETHYFDPRNSQDGQRRFRTGVYMHKCMLSSDDGRTPDGWKVRTLSTLKAEFNPDKPIDILKVDIEGNEWRALPEMLDSGVMGKVRQFLLEVHVLSKSRVGPSEKDYIKYLKVLRDLYLDGFRIASVRGDDVKLPSVGGVMRSQDYEILFLRKKLY